MDKEYECEDCCAVFTVETIEDSEEATEPLYCPFCGGMNINSDADDDDDDDSSLDDDELFDDDED